MTDLTPEQLEVQSWARDFARRHIAPRALALDKDPESPLRDELLREAARAGILGASLPEFLGGAGHDPLTGALATEEYGVEKLLRDAKLTQIYEGTNQINRFEIMEAVSAERGT